MRYAYVEDGKILDGPRSLPKAWRNVSGLDRMPQSDLIKLGWLPWRLVAASKGPDEVPDLPIIEVLENEVVETEVFRTRTPAELEQEAQYLKDSSRAARKVAYIDESDPLFFKVQRGEATLEEWLAKIEEIKSRYPTT
jgi:hypothetical protein